MWSFVQKKVVNCTRIIHLVTIFIQSTYRCNKNEKKKDTGEKRREKGKSSVFDLHKSIMCCSCVCVFVCINIKLHSC